MKRLLRTVSATLIPATGLALGWGVAVAGTASIPPYPTPQLFSPVTVTLGDCAAADTDSMVISWSASTAAQINLTPTVDVEEGFIDEVIRMTFTVAGEALLDVRGFLTELSNYPAPPVAVCPQCSKQTGPVTQSANDLFSAPGVQANYAGSLTVFNGNPIFDALKGGAAVPVVLDAQGDSNVRSWGPNVDGGVATNSQATVSCEVVPQTTPPPPVPAIGPIGAAGLAVGLSTLGLVFGFRRRR